MSMEKLLISACLIGAKCKYSGGANTLPEETLKALKKQYRLIPVCPETAAGLPIPRAPSEIQAGRVLSREGRDVTAFFEKGAQFALELAKRKGCSKALLKENSPSCGSGRIYDGSFCGRLTEGYGFAAAKLKQAGLEVYGETQIQELLK